jgi:hypothetical protein
MKRKKVSAALEKKLRLVRTTVADLSKVKGGYIWTWGCWPAPAPRPDCGYTRTGYDDGYTEGGYTES